MTTLAGKKLVTALLNSLGVQLTAIRLSTQLARTVRQTKPRNRFVDKGWFLSRPDL